MLETGSLNIINSGPSGGKTTLYSQAIRAHLNHEPFFIPGLKFPEGRIAICQTDREYRKYLNTFVPLGLDNHPELEILNFVDDRDLHNLTKPPTKSWNEIQQLECLRAVITKKLKDKRIGTLILDLYDDFHSGGTNNKKASYDGRTNVQWAQDLNVAIVAIVYCFKQTTAKQALRSQDRQGGVLQVQASADWKFTIIDCEEQKTPYYTIAITPAPGKGKKSEILAIRGSEETGDYVGLFSKYEGEPIPSLDEIMVKFECGMTKAYEIRKKLMNGEDSDYIR